MVKYKIVEWMNKVTGIDVVKETSRFVTVKGCSGTWKEAKNGVVFDTFEEAKNKLIEMHEAKIAGLEKQILRHKSRLAEAKLLDGMDEDGCPLEHICKK